MSKLLFTSFLFAEDFCIRIQFLCLDRVITIDFFLICVWIILSFLNRFCWINRVTLSNQMYWIINLRFLFFFSFPPPISRDKQFARNRYSCNRQKKNQNRKAMWCDVFLTLLFLDLDCCKNGKTRGVLVSAHCFPALKTLLNIFIWYWVEIKKKFNVKIHFR